jgi:beta-lactamase regulating signal transducer with metallopeptidase domain
MFNMFNPQSMVSQFDAKTKSYAESVLNTIEAFQVSNVRSFDQFTNSTFTTYTEKLIIAVKEANENAKEIVKTGKLKSFAYVGNKG